ncbi:MAG: hypothetical protein U0794_19475 [Isosphaeraceae bacterium]
MVPIPLRVVNWPSLRRAQVWMFSGQLLLFTLLVALMANTGTPGDLSNRPRMLTTLATITGPFVGAIARNGQSCCLAASVGLALYSGPVLAATLLAQVVPLPEGRMANALRLSLWTVGWLVWFGSGLISFFHAFG